MPTASSHSACRWRKFSLLKVAVANVAEFSYCFGTTVICSQFPEDYPSSAPHIVFCTTNGGKTRFNPNLYSDGKVCLSILGTWRGESGEQWSSVQNCQVDPFPMASLLGLIFSAIEEAKR
jgi:ubiquitin-conjugating enzyme E2 Z